MQNYLKTFEGSDQQWYPTSFTRDIVPVCPVLPRFCLMRCGGVVWVWLTGGIETDTQVGEREAVPGGWGLIGVQLGIWDVGWDADGYVGNI